MGKVLMYEKLTKKFLLVFSLIEPFRRIALRGEYFSFISTSYEFANSS